MASTIPVPPPLIVRSARRFWLSRTAGAALFATASAMALPGGGLIQAMLAVIGLVLFGTLGLYGARQLLRRRPRVVISGEGIEAADLGIGCIPWSEIDSVEIFGSAEAPFLGVVVPAPQRYLASMSPVRRFIVRLLTAQGLPAFSINLIGVDQHPAHIAQCARPFLRSLRPDRSHPPFGR